MSRWALAIIIVCLFLPFVPPGASVLLQTEGDPEPVPNTGTVYLDSWDPHACKENRYGRVEGYFNAEYEYEPVKVMWFGWPEGSVYESGTFEITIHERAVENNQPAVFVLSRSHNLYSGLGEGACPSWSNSMSVLDYYELDHRIGSRVVPGANPMPVKLQIPVEDSIDLHAGVVLFGLTYNQANRYMVDQTVRFFPDVHAVPTSTPTPTYTPTRTPVTPTPTWTVRPWPTATPTETPQIYPTVGYVEVIVQKTVHPTEGPLICFSDVSVGDLWSYRAEFYNGSWVVTQPIYFDGWNCMHEDNWQQARFIYVHTTPAPQPPTVTPTPVPSALPTDEPEPGSRWVLELVVKGVCQPTVEITMHEEAQ